MSTVKEILRTMDYGPAPEAKDVVTAWLQKNKPGFRHYINGEVRGPLGGQFFAIGNAADGTVLALIAQGTEGDVDRAVTAAREAFKTWSKLSGENRARYL